MVMPFLVVPKEELVIDTHGDGGKVVVVLSFIVICTMLAAVLIIREGLPPKPELTN